MLDYYNNMRPSAFQCCTEQSSLSNESGEPYDILSGFRMWLEPIKFQYYNENGDENSNYG